MNHMTHCYTKGTRCLLSVLWFLFSFASHSGFTSKPQAEGSPINLYICRVIPTSHVFRTQVKRGILGMTYFPS